MNTIKVTEFRLLPGDRPLKAFASVQVDYWTTYDWRIIKREGGRAQVSVPQASWRNKEGKVQYRALLSIPRELQQRIEVAILSAWEKELANEKPQV